MMTIAQKKPKAKYFFDIFGGGASMSLMAKQFGLKVFYTEKNGGIVNLLNFLNLYKKQKKIKDYVCADSINLLMRKKLIDICSDLLIDKDLYNLNAGVTFVIV